jgi:hypothetical protein
MKLDRGSPEVRLLMRDGNGDRAFTARYPQLSFEPAGEDFWRSVYTTGAAKLPSQE